MSDTPTYDGYTATIGIECHVQLKTKSKLFSGANNDAREAAPNTLVNHIDFGLPGALPVLNREAVHLAARAAFALGSEPQKFSKFDRKHYFYPDLPLGYQITQYDEPIVLGGSVRIELDREAGSDSDLDGSEKIIGITRAHLEADAGKSTHPAGADYSLVDLNRAGTPLLEIVSEPDMHTPAEAKAYAHELYLRMKYAHVSDANLYYGNMRFDVNVSVTKTGELGTRTETKNINSFRAVEKVVEYEIHRQIEVLEDGGTIIQETRGWDDAKLITVSQRTKEDAHDYRYFPDPDLPPVTLTDDYIEQVRAEMPAMPDEWRGRLASLGLSKSQVETLLDADLEFLPEEYRTPIENGEWYGYLLPFINITDNDFARKLVDLFINIEIPFYRSNNTVWTHPLSERKEYFEEVYELIKSGKVSSTNAKALLNAILSQESAKRDSDEAKSAFGLNWEENAHADNRKSASDLAKEKGYIQESDEAAILAIVDQVIADNPKAAEDVRNGEMKAIGFLTGQVMKASQGKANPGLAQQLIRKQLGL